MLCRNSPGKRTIKPLVPSVLGLGLVGRTALAAFAGLLLAAAPARAQTMHFVAAPLPPLVIDAEGKPDGIVLDVLGELAETTGTGLSVEFLPQARALYEAERRSDLGFAGLTRNAEREASFKWVGPVLSDSIVLMTRRGVRAAPTTLEAARGWSVGAVRGGASIPALREAGYADIVELQDAETGARLLETGRIEAWATPKLSGLYLFRKLGFDPASLEMGPLVRRNDLFLGLPRNTPDQIVVVWKDRLERLRANGTVAAIVARYVPGAAVGEP